MSEPQSQQFGEMDGVSFDLSGITPPVDVPMPDHTASADMPKDAPESAPSSRARLLQLGKEARERKNARQGKPKPDVPKTRPGALVKPLTELYVSIGTGLMAVDPICGMAVIDNSKSMATALDALAKENDAVRRVLLRLVETSAWGGVMIAHLPLLLAITAHHAPRDIAEKVAPFAMMMNPNVVKAQQEAARAMQAEAEQEYMPAQDGAA